jgi:hypothetical protein
MRPNWYRRKISVMMATQNKKRTGVNKKSKYVVETRKIFVCIDRWNREPYDNQYTVTSIEDSAMANVKLYFNTPLTRLFTTWNIYSHTSIQLTFKYWLFAVLIESRWGSEMFTSAPLRSRFKLYSDPGSLSNRIQSSYIFSGFPSEIIMPRMQFEYIISFWRLNIGQTITSRWARGANRYIEEKVRQVNSLDNG